MYEFMQFRVSLDARELRSKLSSYKGLITIVSARHVPILSRWHKNMDEDFLLQAVRAC